jgi:hypothetical protein
MLNGFLRRKDTKNTVYSLCAGRKKKQTRQTEKCVSSRLKNLKR